MTRDIDKYLKRPKFVTSGWHVQTSEVEGVTLFSDFCDPSTGVTGFHISGDGDSDFFSFSLKKPRLGTVPSSQ